MITIKDIAREAGVSHGTVSNVLNKTGKVRVEKIRLVEAAIAKLGYTYNTPAKQLRQGGSKNVALILPSLLYPCYLYLYESLHGIMSKNGFTVIPYETRDIVSSEEDILNSDVLAGVAAVVTVSCLENELAKYKLPCPIIFINRAPSKITSDISFVSFDFKQAGLEIGKYILDNKWENAVYLASSTRFQDSALVLKGLQKALTGENVSIQQCNFDLPLENNMAFELFRENPDVEVIVTCDLLLADALSAAAQLLYLKNKPQIITIAPYKTIPNNRFINYEMNYTYMGNIVGEILLKRLQNKQALPEKKIISEQGFRIYFTAEKHVHRTLSLLTLSTPTAEALKTLCPSFYHLTGIELKITAIPYDDIMTQLQLQNEAFYFDLIRMDIAWFTELGDTIFKPLSQVIDNLSELPHHVLLDSYRDYTTVGQTMYSLPFDPSVLVLLYRKDLFEDAVLRRAYYEMYHESLEVPTTFERYERAARFFTKSINLNSPVDYGNTITFGSSSVAACGLLPRLYAACPDLCKGGVLNVDNDHFKKAFSDYIKSFQYASKSEHSWWNSSLMEFAAGKSAMTITFSNYASYTICSKYSKIIGKVGASVIPGGHPLLGGGLIGASKFTTKNDEILQFLRWYYSKDISSLIITLGGSVPLPDILYTHDFSLYPWLNIFYDSLKIGTRNLDLYNVPDFSLRKFENILGSMAYNVIKGIMTLDEAIKYIQNLYSVQSHP